MTLNYAHRGARGYYPENTMLAFEKAIEMGCDGIETDVQMTKDGVLVLIHDEMVNRTTNGAGLVKDFNYHDLRKLDAGSFFSRDYAGQTIPNVEELLSLAREKRIKINFEIKTGIINYPNIEEKLIDLIYRYGMQNNVICSSFNHYSMVKIKEIDPSIKTGLLYMEGLYKPHEYCKMVGADALHPYFYAVNGEVMKMAKESGILVNTFTVNDINHMKHFKNIGLDGIITDYPDKLKNILEE